MIKKVALLILIIIASVSVLVSCAEDTDTTTTKSSPIVDPDNTSKEQGYEVSSKRYAYKKYDTVLLNVKNTSHKNCTITVTVNFFKEDGTMFHSSTQNFEGVAAGDSQAFFFHPRIAFDSYTYTVETKEYSGECLLQHLKLEEPDFLIARTKIGDDSKGNAVWGEGLFYRGEITNTYGKKIYYRATFIVMDDSGNIYSIDSRLRQDFSPPHAEGTFERAIYDQNGIDIKGPKNEVTWPDALKGDSKKVIILVTAIDTEPLLK